VIGGIGLWFQWGRFRPATPSLVDEWFGVTYSAPALHALLRGDYFSSGLDFGGRYRPGYTAVWNYLQWHVPFDHSATTAALWGIARIGLFLGAIWILAAWLAGTELRAGRWSLWLAPLAVAITPGIADDLTRYGPADPMMVAGLIIGLALIAWGVRRLRRDARTRVDWALAGMAIGGGYLVYLLGVYSKEASFFLLVFPPFLLLWLGPEGRRRYLPRSGTEWASSVVLVALLVAPLLHVAARVALAFESGVRAYPTPHYTVGWRLYTAFLSPLLGAPASMQTWLWFLGVVVAIALAAIRLGQRQRDGWLLLGVLLTGYFMTSLALIRGEMGSWYYVSWIVAVSAVAIQVLLRGNTVTRLGVLVLVLLISVSGTRASLREWAAKERSGSTAVALAKGISEQGCPVYLANFDIEPRVALPLLFSYARSRPVGGCGGEHRAAYAISWQNAALSGTFAADCPAGWHRLRLEDNVATYRCASMRPTAIPDQNAASGLLGVRTVRLSVSRQPPRPREIFQAPAPG
jgi:hypothetical protein